MPKFKDRLKKLEQDLRPTFKAVDGAAHKIEKEVVRPAAHAVDDAAHQVEKDTIRPVAHAYDQALAEAKNQREQRKQEDAARATATPPASVTPP